MKTAEVLRQRLEMIYRWHGGMVNPDTGMLEYLYFPQTDAFVRTRFRKSCWTIPSEVI
jgi:hypothetical protein